MAFAVFTAASSALSVASPEGPAMKTGSVNAYQMVFWTFGPGASISDDALTSLQNIQADGHTPLLIIDVGGSMNYSSQASDDVLKGMLDATQARGIADKGIAYIILSEYDNAIGLPAKVYVDAVNHMSSFIKENQPEAKTGVLIDTVWNSGNDSRQHWGFWPVEPWVAGVDNETGTPHAYKMNRMDVYIHQGFPKPRANPSEVDAGIFINATSVVEIAKKIGASKVIVNTGVASTNRGMNNSHDEKQVIINSIERQMLLVNQHLPGVEVDVHWFAENKTDAPENNDWTVRPEDYPMLKRVEDNMTNSGIGMIFWDPAHLLKNVLY